MRVRFFSRKAAVASKARMYARDTSSCRKSSQINDSMEYILDMILSKNEIFLFMASKSLSFFLL
jgi:hypothetical protein